MRAWLALAAIACGSGCALTTMTPAHKLERGQVVLQGALDEPGFLFVPRLSAQATFGTGGGDLGLHLGTAGFLVNGGATARAYIGERWALSAQGDVALATFKDSLFSGNTQFGLATFTPRFGRVLTARDERFFWGLQAPVLVPFAVDESGDLPSTVGFAFGAYIGAAWDFVGNIDLQFELSASPVGIFRGVYTEDDSYGVGLTPLAQIGIGLQYRKERQNPSNEDPSALPPQHDSNPRHRPNAPLLLQPARVP